jgi:hypothetical protein
MIRALSESGQPPKLGASYLNVGTESILKRLRSDYLDDLLMPYDGLDGGGACKWIEANYGNGKTQFLRCAQEHAWQANYITAFVELSQDECPLDRPDKVYSAIAQSIQASPHSTADVDRGKGIDVTLNQLLDRKFEGVLTGTPNDDLRDAAAMWVQNSLAATPVDSSGFRTAVVQYLMATLGNDYERSQLAAVYLKGEPHSANEAKDIGLHEKLDKSTGFRFLRSLCQLIQRSELAKGTVLLFDEARRSLSLMSSKAQKVACENLLTIINRCNSGDLPGTLFLYAVMPEFFADFATAYPALQQRCGPGTRINLETLSGVKEQELLEGIGLKIVDIFSIAYEDAPQNKSDLQKSLRVVCEESLRQTRVGSGTRRLFVSTWTRALQGFREQGVKALTPDDVQGLMEGVRVELDAADKESIAGLGE